MYLSHTVSFGHIYSTNLDKLLLLSSDLNSADGKIPFSFRSYTQDRVTNFKTTLIYIFYFIVSKQNPKAWSKYKHLQISENIPETFSNIAVMISFGPLEEKNCYMHLLNTEGYRYIGFPFIHFHSS